MQAISVQSAQGQYDIHVGDALLKGVGAGIVKKIPKARVALLVVDHAVEQTWAREVAASLEAAGLRVVTHVVVASEDNKSIAQVGKIWREQFARPHGWSAMFARSPRFPRASFAAVLLSALSTRYWLMKQCCLGLKHIARDCAQWIPRGWLNLFIDQPL